MRAGICATLTSLTNHCRPLYCVYRPFTRAAGPSGGSWRQPSNHSISASQFIYAHLVSTRRLRTCWPSITVDIRTGPNPSPECQPRTALKPKLIPKRLLMLHALHTRHKRTKHFKFLSLRDPEQSTSSPRKSFDTIIQAHPRTGIRDFHLALSCCLISRLSWLWLSAFRSCHLIR